MNNHRTYICFLLGIAMTVIPYCPAFAEGIASGKWKESTPGRWESLPERHVGGTDNGISIEVTMPPGSGVSYARNGHWAPGSAELRFAVDNVNAGSNDYLPREALFPASVTFVFGDDRLKLGAQRRVSLFLEHLWSGFPPKGIRLTFAWGNVIPVGSMYRLREEETVFVVAGPEEVGKTVSATRRLEEDFRAAYGFSPKGPVKEIRVNARRSAREKGPAHGSITVRFPSE
jgi:hypothetical protein